MTKTILITGATDGIGLATTKMLLAQGHKVIMHGRSAEKMSNVVASLQEHEQNIEQYIADLSDLKQVAALANSIAANHTSLDVLINNAGVLKTANTRTTEGLDIRIVVNTLAPYLLTKTLLPLLLSSGRVVNVSSAANAPVDLAGLSGDKPYETDMDAYAQSKLAITMLSRFMAAQADYKDIVVVAVNPGSLLASKMVKEGFGIAGSDINIGADILCRAALSEEFAGKSGQYYDNDGKSFADHHEDVLDDNKVKSVVAAIEKITASLAPV